MSRLGDLITRRQSLGLAGLAGAAYVTGVGCGDEQDGPAVAEAQTPSCVLVAEVTEGPYFLDGRLRRSDIRANSSGGAPKDGIPLALTINVVEVGANGRCTPYRGAAVDIWHCDAEGVYSGVQGTDGDFLRGYQVTNAAGAVTFKTIFPGWYRGRAIHIHVKVRTFNGSTATYEYTSQLFFSDTTIAQAYSAAPYSANGDPDTSNSADGIYGQTGGTSLVSTSGSAASGYTGRVTLGLADLPDPSGSEAEGRLLETRWIRHGRGRRTLRATLDLDERMQGVHVRVVREGRTIASQKLTGVRGGTRTVRVSVGRGAAAGPAMLVIAMRGQGADAKIVRRHIRIPRKLG